MTTSNAELVVYSDTPAATHALGRELGRLATPGLVVALIGRLGMGKTLFVRGVAEGLGVVDWQRVVSSPTFVFLQEYAGRLPIYHFDTYRLSRSQDFIDLGPEEYLEGAGVCLIEWADRVMEHLPNDRLTIEFQNRGESCREIFLTAPCGTSAARIIDELRRTKGLAPPGGATAD
jgi:tRNA threonylcarbamoyladenosine biosynthesis protein TsaE